MWAREMVMWYLSVDARFCQLSIHFDMDGVKRGPLSSLYGVCNWREEFKQIATATSTTAVVDAVSWGEYVS